MPIVSSVFNWLSPIQHEKKIKGRTFDLSSGNVTTYFFAQPPPHNLSFYFIILFIILFYYFIVVFQGSLQTTEKTYKYHMQVQDGEEATG